MRDTRTISAKYHFQRPLKINVLKMLQCKKLMYPGVDTDILISIFDILQQSDLVGETRFIFSESRRMLKAVESLIEVIKTQRAMQAAVISTESELSVAMDASLTMLSEDTCSYVSIQECVCVCVCACVRGGRSGV